MKDAIPDNRSVVTAVHCAAVVPNEQIIVLPAVVQCAVGPGGVRVKQPYKPLRLCGRKATEFLAAVWS